MIEKIKFLYVLFLTSLWSLMLFSSCAVAVKEGARLSEEEKIQEAEVLDSISEEKLLGYVRKLSSKDYAGRLTGTPEYRACARWMAFLFEKWGLKPAGDDKTYLQSFPNPYTIVFVGGELAYTYRSRGARKKRNYAYEKEYYPGSNSGDGKLTAEVVYAGFGITAPELNYDDYAGVNVKGKIVVIEPEVLLMDEPLSNLDAKLRVEMRGEIRLLQQKMGITTIYVTHDQEEALSISDRIAVMEYGIVRQVGKPWEVYVQPEDTFVAGFIGTTNMLDSEVKASKAQLVVAQCGGVAFGLSQSDGLTQGTRIQIALRPEAITIRDIDEPVPDGHWALEGEIIRFEYLGSMIKYEVGFSESVTLLVVSYDAEPGHIRNVGQRVKMSYPLEKIKTFRKDRPQ